MTYTVRTKVYGYHEVDVEASNEMEARMKAEELFESACDDADQRLCLYEGETTVDGGEEPYDESLAEMKRMYL